MYVKCSSENIVSLPITTGIIFYSSIEYQSEIPLRKAYTVCESGYNQTLKDTVKFCAKAITITICTMQL